MVERRKEIKYILNSLPSERSLKKLGDPKKLPLIGLYSACQRFLSGFDDDCVLHSAFACEMALLLMLDKKLDETKKKEIKKHGGLSFGKTIGIAKKLNIIDRETLEKINILKNLRDMYAHPANWVTLIKSIEYDVFHNQELIKKALQEASLTKSEINHLSRKLNHQKASEAYEKIEKYLKQRLGKIPTLEWAAEPGTLEFQKKRAVQTLLKRIINDMVKKGEMAKLLKYRGSIPNYIIRKYPFPKQIALEALRIAYEVLKALHFI